MPSGNSRKKVNRRKFLTDTARTAGGVGLVGLALGLYSGSARNLHASALRPPGALAEKDFLAACTRCGLCARDCPYDILELAKLGDRHAATGTPYFTARDAPCEMCEDIPCVKACPTGALDPDLSDINNSRMGLAVIVDSEACIAFQGLRCEVCYNVCPLRKQALQLEHQPNQRTGIHALFVPVVSSDACTGCGLCERACILEEAAIKVMPIDLVKGRSGEHYRLGWVEKDRRGEPLVKRDSEHKFNLPDNMEYDYYGTGLSKKNGKKPTPYGPDISSNPLDTLNRAIREIK